ncbi:MAG TPA: type VI secretion system contractile sheath protein TssC, partial [Prolixibacteraceae bacterium]|nr:type VI secretion system contractile sheath protein TssC [Prolixibacteraceae bacterium]
MVQQEQQRQNIEQFRERVLEKIEKIDNSQELLKTSLSQLSKVGGFDLLEVAIDGAQNLNPERKARKKIFLSESSKKEERDELKKTLELWAAVLSSSDDVMEMIEKCEQGSQVAE